MEMTMMRCKYAGVVLGEKCRECWDKINTEKPKWFLALAPDNISQCRKLNRVELPKDD